MMHVTNNATMKLSYLLNQTFICQLCNRLIMVQIPFLGKDVITHCWENNIIIKVNKCLLIFLSYQRNNDIYLN